MTIWNFHFSILSMRYNINSYKLIKFFKLVWRRYDVKKNYIQICVSYIDISSVIEYVTQRMVNSLTIYFYFSFII